MPQSAPVSVYVHVPFCEQKCAYCDFFTVTDPERKHPLSKEWLNLCFSELELLSSSGELSRERPIQSVFFGGGTPSLLPPEQHADFLARVRSSYNLLVGAEITLETQPGTVDSETFRSFSEAGVTRFSIGVQTFDEEILERTRRRHTVDEARDAVRGAAATGRLVSLDLICAFPGQSLEGWSHDLEQAVSFSPHGISVYELTYHAGTEFHRQLQKGRIHSAEDEVRVAMFEHTRQVLTAAGYEHYEISNYARPGGRSVHNENYWRLGDYIGLGGGAHSFLYPHRYYNPNSAEDYARAIRSGRLFRRSADTEDPLIFLLENLQMALRRSEGVNLEEFGARFGAELLQARMPRFRQLEQEGLVRLTRGTVVLTNQGRLQADTITEFLI